MWPRLTGRGLLIGQASTLDIGYFLMDSPEFGVNRVARPRLLLAASACLAIFAFAALPTGALAQRTVKARYGEWEMRCETPPGAKTEQCYLSQSVSPEDRPNVTLFVIVLKTADGKSRLLRVIAPLGVLLTNGVGLTIDGVTIGRAPFIRCVPIGCTSEADIDSKLIEQLSKGQTATFEIFQTPEEGVGIQMPLAGFKDGFEKLP
jgi:invasion protein IalB